MGRFSTALVVSEIAISTSLLIGAGLLVRSVVNLRTLDLGFRTEDVMTGRVTLQSDYPTREARHDFYRELGERLRAEPGVRAASLTTSLPGTGASRWSFQVEGEAYGTDADYPVAFGAVVTPGFFETFGATLLQGRDFTGVEAEWTDDRVVIVNQSFAARYFPGGETLGRRIRLGRSGSTSPSMRVVGVVPDLHVGGGVGGIGDDRQSPEHMYVPTGMLDVSSMSLAVRTQEPPEAIAARMRAIVQAMDPDLPLYATGSMESVMETNTWAFGLFGTIFSIFGVVALLLASVGLYGVLAFTVNQRRKEVGVRMALGASGRAILGMILRRGLWQLGVGLGIGLGIGALMARPLAVILFGVQPVDAVVYAAIVLTLGTAGLAACLVPARAATRTDPIEAMRIE
jgi:predicted permease